MHSFSCHLQDMSIHERLRQARIKRGYPRAVQAAEALGVKYATYAGHESGSRGLSLETIKRYAAFFGVTVEWLTSDDKTQNSNINISSGLIPLADRSVKWCELPIKAKLEWGAFLAEEAMDDLGVLRCAVFEEYLNKPLAAYLMADDSAGDLAPKGHHIIAMPLADYEKPLDHGSMMILRRRDGEKSEFTLRSLRLAVGAAKLVLPSHDPKWRGKAAPFDGAEIEGVALLVQHQARQFQVPEE